MEPRGSEVVSVGRRTSVASTLSKQRSVSALPGDMNVERVRALLHGDTPPACCSGLRNG